MKADNKIIFKELGDEAALLNSEDGEFYTLNETGKDIWNSLVKNKFDVNAAARILCEGYEITENEAAASISEFIEELKSQKLVK